MPGVENPNHERPSGGFEMRLARLEERVAHLTRASEADLLEFKAGLLKLDRQTANLSRSMEKQIETQTRLTSTLDGATSRLAAIDQSLNERLTTELTQIRARSIVLWWLKLLLAVAGIAWLVASGSVASGLEALLNLIRSRAG